MDVNLPGIDGLEATRRIVASGSDARILVLSTYSGASTRRRRLAAGAVGFVSKDDFGPGLAGSRLRVDADTPATGAGGSDARAAPGRTAQRRRVGGTGMEPDATSHATIDRRPR
jgi:chemotaxis response regulator CheB